MEGLGWANFDTDPAEYTDERIIIPGGFFSIHLKTMRRTFHGTGRTEGAFFNDIVKLSPDTCKGFPLRPRIGAGRPGAKKVF
jgi:hypothetical protein